MKKIISLTMVLSILLLTLIPLSVSAATSGTCGDNLTWTLDDNGTLTISGEGKLNTTNYINTRPWYSLNANITSIVVEDGVTEIGDYAFSSCTNLKNVTLGKDIKHIGENAFVGSRNVENLYLSSLESYLNITFESVYSSYPTTSQKIYIDGVLLTDIVIPDGITSIPSNIFSGNLYITSLIAPDSVIEIGDHAFQGCNNLTEITLGSGIKKLGTYAFDAYFIKNLYLKDLNSYMNIEFKDSTGIPSSYADIYVDGNLLTDVVIPEGITIIPAGIFQWNKHITSITIPDSVTEIGDRAFEGCNSLKFVTIGKTEITYGENVFCNKLEKLFLTNLDSYMNSKFSNLYSYPSYLAEEIYLNNLPLSNVEIPYGSTKIVPGLYKNNTSIIIPNTVKEISDGAFKNCDKITEITIPEGVTRIGYEAFKDCDNLVTIVIPNTVTYIDDYAFEYCYELKNINFPDSIEYIGYRIFYNMTDNYGEWINGGFYVGNHLIDTSYDISEDFIIRDGTICIAGGAFSGKAITSVQIPNSVVFIGERAFYSCNRLNQIIIPESVAKIGDGAFYYCENLKNVTLKNGITHIGYQAFLNCSNLTEIILPDTLTSLGANAFSGCTGLSNVVLSNELKEIQEWTFDGCSNLINITIPNSITNIKLIAFNGCNNLQNVYFLGTEKQWGNMIIGDLNDPLLNATIHYITPSTKTTVEEHQFTVTPMNVPNGSTIIFACYNDKQMVFVDTFTYAGESTIPFTTTETYDKVKVMVWENLKTLIPLCEAEDVNIN